MKTLKLDCFLTKVRASRHIKCILPHIHKFIFETVQKQHVLYSFKAMADTTDKDKLYLLHARVKREDFCDVLEMKLTSPLGGIQQVGASETTAKTVAPLEKTTTKKKQFLLFLKLVSAAIPSMSDLTAHLVLRGEAKINTQQILYSFRSHVKRLEVGLYFCKGQIYSSYLM